MCLHLEISQKNPESIQHCDNVLSKNNIYTQSLRGSALCWINAAFILGFEISSRLLWGTPYRFWMHVEFFLSHNCVFWFLTLFPVLCSLIITSYAETKQTFTQIGSFYQNIWEKLTFSYNYLNLMSNIQRNTDPKLISWMK